MRWKRRRKTFTSEGEKRIVKRFLFWPVTICYETRWFEVTSYEQIYIEPAPWWSSVGWVNLRWMEV